MAVNKLKKINVRSPYYITVDNVQEATVDPIEPVEQESTITCGSTTQVGVDVGTRTFKISTEGRELGDFTISFSGIKTPIKYRIGHSANMPSYATAGLDSYATEWNTATGESPTLSDFGANPNGVSATATYTSTQGDIDLYGEEIQLEIQQPIITEGYSFSLSCPAIAEDDVPVDNGFVVIVSFARIYSRSQASTANELSVNGTVFGNNSVSASRDVVRYVMSDQVPNLVPLSGNQYSSEGVLGSEFFVRSAFPYSGSAFVDTFGNNNTTAAYKSEDILSSGINDLSVVNTQRGESTTHFQILISRHPVRTVNGVNYILGSQDTGVYVRALNVLFTLNSGERMDMTFRGSNSTELEGLLAVREYSSTETDWDEGALGIGDETQILNIETITIQPITG